ncbi:hypothetical protein EYZ11_013098 [Aspergillus tanneri]|uniref:Uncharacterized protein n=1 Tax=Aspergillus tanneri TaxID=1220188 RepID=A0A4S3IYS6_9EURO|nr:hypothetical protein EYZ11_013098 [Aspergillus tanneri]
MKMVARVFTAQLSCLRHSPQATESGSEVDREPDELDIWPLIKEPTAALYYEEACPEPEPEPAEECYGEQCPEVPSEHRGGPTHS